MWETLVNSEKFRQRAAGLWFLTCIVIAGSWLHYFTDFEVNRLEWWIYLFDVVRIERRPPTPYVYAIVILFVVFFIGNILARLRFKRRDYGDAKRATARDLKKMELDGADNITIGQFGKRPIIPKHIRHTMVIAGTRSGKTQGICIPTLNSYKGSVVVIDPKGELWEKTAGYRSKFSDCYRLEWTAEQTARYNPISLKVLPDTPAEIELRAGQIASILAPAGDDYWTKDAQKVLRALILLEIFDAKHEGRDASLENVAHFSGDVSDVDLEDYEDENVSPLQVKLLQAAQRAAERNYPRSCTTDLGDMANMAPNTRSGVFGTLVAEIQVLKTAAIANAISGCDVNSKMLVEGERPVTLYIVVKPKDAAFTSILTTTLITNFIYDLVSRSDQEAKDQHSVLFLLEEFSAMKRTAAIGELLDRGAGLGVHAMIVIQSFSQVRKIYSEDDLKTIINNSDYLVVFAVTDADTQAWLERLVGKTTRRRESRSEADKGHASSSVSYEGVPFIMAQEWGEIPFGEHRILVRYHTTRPIFAKTGFAFKDKAFSKRMQIEPPAPMPPGANDNAMPTFNVDKESDINLPAGFRY